MKTIYRFIILFATLLVWTGCVREEIAEDFSVEIMARMESEADTRTSLSGLQDGMYYPLWSAGDEIAVYVDGDADPSKFYLKSGDGTTVAQFTGTRKGEEYLAVYPYEIAGSVSDDTLSVTLPSTQKYVKDSFGPGAFPMLATGSANDGLTFMNLCSVLKISLTGTAAVRSVTLTANDEDTFMSGPASAVTDYTSASESLLSMSAGGSRSVVLDTKGLEISEDSPADVFIVVPSQTYAGGFTIEIDTYTDTLKTTVTSDVTFERSQIRAIKELTLDSEVPELIPDAIPDDEIWYVSDNSEIIPLDAKVDFGAEIISHEYINGLGIIKFDGDVTKIDTRNCGLMFTQGNLLKLVLPETIKSISVNPFYLQQNLVEFMGPLASEDGKCLMLDGRIIAFAQSGVEEYKTPDGATAIGPMAFYRNIYLKKIVISEGVKSIGREAFFCDISDDTKLEEVYLPSTLETMEYYTFTRCRNIKRFYGNNKFVTDDGYSLAIENYNNLGKKYIVHFASAAGLTSYTIPEGIQGIENYCFYGAEDLKSLAIPATVDAIGSSAFEEAYNIESLSGPNVLDDNRSYVVDGRLLYVADKGLTKYIVPDSVTILAYGVFSDKQYVEEIHMSDNVTHVDGYGYLFCHSPKLKTVTISARFQNFELDPFGFQESKGGGAGKCESLETVYLRAVVPPFVYYNDRDAIPGLYENLTIYVPQDSYDAYMSSQSWSPYREYFEPYDYGDLSEFYPDYYISSDYSSDGGVETLQTATVGNGIDIVLMGDAYSDREIADGSYEADMEYMYDNLFTQEPFKTHKDMFNVYYVNVVSMTEGYENSGAALGGFFGDGTLVGGNDNKCFEYALKAVSEDRMDEALIIVAMNSDAYAGTCYMYYPESATGTYGSGPAVAYFPKGGDQTTFAQLLHHEANGHGFAKLADEYAYEDYGAVPDANVTQTRDQQNNWGWWKNVDFTSDPEQVRWSYFLEDERYANEGLGVFEGGLTYWTGVWRPTEDSIMRYNTGGFNAPSREAIWYRIHKLAYGDSWEYDYEDFVEYDAVNRSTSASAPQKTRRNYVERPLEPTAAPVVVGKSWRNAL